MSYALAMGYELTYGDAYRSPLCRYGHPTSLHRKRLAIDMNLFRDGKYITRTEDHRFLGEYWKTLAPDARWGGDFAGGDGNHYSLEHEGMR